jgi:hypothetical protein
MLERANGRLAAREGRPGRSGLGLAIELAACAGSFVLGHWLG